MTTLSLEQRAAAYIAKMPPAIAGNGGHRATFSVACRLVEFGLSFDRALPLLLAWNQSHCQPQWSESDLRHKLCDAFKRTSPKPGYVTRQVVTGRGYRVAATPPLQASKSPMQSPSTLLNRRSNRILERSNSQNTAIDPKIQLAAKIQALLENNKPRPAATSHSPIAAGIESIMDSFAIGREFQNIKALAQLRGLTQGAVMSAHTRGLVRFGNHYGKPAWFILDKSQRVAAARRMDGLPWFEGTPDACKSVILPGSQAKWPVGIREAQGYPKILLCEGGPDLLAAFQFIWGGRDEFAPVTMLSASYAIHTDALRLFKGKRVRIFAHNDPQGFQAAHKWKAQIEGHTNGADVFLLGFYGVNDLNDFARANLQTSDLLP